MRCAVDASPFLSGGHLPVSNHEAAGRSSLADAKLLGRPAGPRPDQRAATLPVAISYPGSYGGGKHDILPVARAVVTTR